jgi:GntR family transcriptional regulator/MocR family aminotransferase
VQPGDKVAVERLGYPPAWKALRAAGGVLVPVNIDDEGMDPDSLAKTLRGQKIRLIYITPQHQYPTTATLPISRRLRIYELAARAGVPILEDDYDHEFHYRSQPLAPLASRDPDGLVVYVSTFSKVLFPSARIGLMAVPAGLTVPLTAYKGLVTRQNETLIEDALARWIASGGFERHLRRMRRIYEERRDAAIESLTQGKAAGYPLSWYAPDGGMAIWLNVGADADRVARRAGCMGAYVAPESVFQLIRTPSRHLRLGFANQSSQEIRQGLRLVLQAIAAEAGRGAAQTLRIS